MSNSGKKQTDDDEVEQLLRAAQDDVLLKLSVHSHIARASAIDPDLDRRFQALRKPQKPAKINDSVKKAPTEMDDKADGVATDDDLFARFAALKKSLPSYSGNEDKSDESVNQEEDEVEKVISWAIDAARLDPSPQSDIDDDNDDESDDGYDDESDDGREKKGKRE